MNLKYIYIILILISCNQETSNKRIDKELIFEVEKNSAIFFYPNEKIIESIIEKYGEESGIYESFDDFSYYAGQIIEIYKDSSIIVKATDKQYFKINDSIINKDELNSAFGLIIYKNKNEFKIDEGIGTDIDYINIINEEFN